MPRASIEQQRALTSIEPSIAQQHPSRSHERRALGADDGPFLAADALQALLRKALKDSGR